MNPAADLWYDHDVLRGKLFALEVMLPAFPSDAFTITRLIDSLAACLRAHTEREERLLDARLRQPHEPPPALLQQLHDVHENHRMRLAVLHALLSEGPPFHEAQIRAYTTEFIGELRAHLTREEALFFPVSGQPKILEEAVDANGAVEPYLLGLA